MNGYGVKIITGGKKMFESRCGVCCNSCERREKVNCNGCVNMEKPFWGGECGVKKCCEERELNQIYLRFYIKFVVKKWLIM